MLSLNFSQKNEHHCRITDVFENTDKSSVLPNYTSMIQRILKIVPKFVFAQVAEA